MALFRFINAQCRGIGLLFLALHAGPLSCGRMCRRPQGLNRARPRLLGRHYTGRAFAERVEEIVASGGCAKCIWQVANGDQ